MSDLKLLRISSGRAAELEASAVALEKSLQTLIEGNLESVLRGSVESRYPPRKGVI